MELNNLGQIVITITDSMRAEIANCYDIDIANVSDDMVLSVHLDILERYYNREYFDPEMQWD